MNAPTQRTKASGFWLLSLTVPLLAAVLIGWKLFKK